MFDGIDKLEYHKCNMFKKLIARFIELMLSVNRKYILIDSTDLVSVENDFKNIPEAFISCEQVVFKYGRGNLYTLYFNYLSKIDAVSVVLIYNNESYVYHFKLDDLMNREHKQKYFQRIQSNPSIDLAYDLIGLMVDELNNVMKDIPQLS